MFININIVIKFVKIIIKAIYLIGKKFIYSKLYLYNLNEIYQITILK